MQIELFNLAFFGFLLLGGMTDLLYRRIKHWQFAIFTFFVLISLLFHGGLSLLSVGNFSGILLVGWLIFATGKIGGADVRVMAVSALYDFYRYNPWWVLEALILTGIIDLLMWFIRFRRRRESTPLLLAWAIAVSVVYLLSTI